MIPTNAMDQDSLNPSGPSTKELKRMKKEKKMIKEAKLIKKLEKREMLKKASILEAAKPIPKNIVNSGESLGRGREYTVSIAVPGSVLDNAQSPELRTYLAGQVARAAAVFAVDEVIVFDDEASGKPETTEGEFQGVGKKGGGCVQLARILQYLECPQYLRRNFFPIHPDLQYAGILNPTDMPHHLRRDEKSIWREGVVADKPSREGTSLVNIGLTREVLVNRNITPGVRVTVRLEEDWGEGGRQRGFVVSPREPTAKSGLYWGYQVRLADSLSSVFSGCSYKGGYDVTLGTSEKGEDVDKVELEGFKHLLIVFGGVAGLESALEADDKLKADDPSELFDLYLNTCPSQGSRTIRTEEAILVSLAALRPKIDKAVV